MGKIDLTDMHDFNLLVANISAVQEALQVQAAHAINLALTARNWLIGYYIVEYEQNGNDRAQYGEQLINRLSKRIDKKGLEPRRLREFRQFYQTYPQLVSVLKEYLLQNGDLNTLSSIVAKWQLPTAILDDDSSVTEIWRSPTAKLEAWETSPEKLFNRLSATHLLFLSTIADPLKRAFYEQEAIRSCWTMKELDRQVSSLYYERMGLSKNKKALQRQLAESNRPIRPSDIIRDPVSLEFLGLQSQDVYSETKLETAILNHLQQFLLEMD